MTMEPADSRQKRIDQLVRQDEVGVVHEGHAQLSAVRLLRVRREHPQHLDPEVQHRQRALAEPEVRAHMKEYSDWPTFPQLVQSRASSSAAPTSSSRCSRAAISRSSSARSVAPAKAVKVTVSPRAKRELDAALKEGTPGDVIHLTITGGWEHQLDLGPRESDHVTVDAVAASPSSSIARARRRPTASRSTSSRTRPAPASRSRTRIARPPCARSGRSSSSA